MRDYSKCILFLNIDSNRGKEAPYPLGARYLITNSDLNQYELVVNGDLLNYGYLKQAFLRYKLIINLPLKI